MDGILGIFNRCTAMKKTFLTLGAAFLVLVACNKEINAPSVIGDSPKVLTFSSDKPQIETETKTAWDSESSSIIWTTGDRIRVGYTLDGNWMAAAGPADFSVNPKVSAKFFSSTNVVIDALHANKGTFSVPSGYTNSPTGSAVFYGIYPSSCTETDSDSAPSLTVTIPASQTPGANTFDKSADIMVGKTDATELSGVFPTDPLAMEWNRIVAHADITFKNLAIDGDTEVDKITLVFNSEAKVVGRIYLDVTNGAVTTTGSSTNQVEILGENLSISAGTIKAWTALLPVTFTSVDVTVKTDIATYTRSITGISKTFKKNAHNTLGINMSSATRTLNTNLIADGNYVLAVKNGDDYFAISSEKNGNSARRDRVSISTPFNPVGYSAVSPYLADNAIIWTITNVTGGVKMNLAGDATKYMQYGSNTLPLGESGAIFAVANGTTSGTYTFTNNSRKIRMNGTYGFGCYDASTDIDFYVVPATGTPTISFEETNKNAAADDASIEFTYSTVFVAGDPSVDVTSDAGNAVASTSISGGTLTVNLNENTTSSPKTITLTVSATGAVDVVLTIIQAGIVADALNGDTLWAEAFTGFSDSAVPAASNESTTVYGSGTVTYTCTNGGSTTKVYGNDNNAGGVKPELLISKTNGSFVVSGIPTGNATGMTLSFKANNGNITVTSTTASALVTSNIGTTTAPVYGITVPGGTKTLNITFSNAESSNTRVDDIVLVAGAPVPSITVATNAATSTASAAGTTATVNGTITLVNGAVIGDVDEAGFYYKLTSAGSFTKVKLDSAPTTTSFSYDLTGLTKDAEYTFKAYAIYDGGGEVEGETLTFTPTQSGGGGGSAASSWSYTASLSDFGNNGYNTTLTTDLTLNGKAWTASAGAISGSKASSGYYFSTHATNGVQIGASKAYFTYILSSSAFSGTISEIQVVSTNATVSVSVGGTAMTKSGSSFTLATPKSGEIVITLGESSGSAIYLNSIAINPE